MDKLVPAAQRQQKFFELRTALVQPPVRSDQVVSPIKVNPRDIVANPSLDPDAPPAAPVGSPFTGPSVPNTPEVGADPEIQQEQVPPPVKTEARNILDLMVSAAYVVSVTTYPVGPMTTTNREYLATVRLQLPIVSEVLMVVQFVVSAGPMILQELSTDQLKQLFSTREVHTTQTSTVRAYLVFKDDPLQLVDVTGWDCTSADTFVKAVNYYGEQYMAELETVAKINQSNRTMARFLLILQKEATAITEWLKSFPTCLV